MLTECAYLRNSVVLRAAGVDGIGGRRTTRISNEGCKDDEMADPPLRPRATMRAAI